MLGEHMGFEVCGLRNHTEYRCHLYARSITYRRNIWAEFTGGLCDLWITLRAEAFSR